MPFSSKILNTNIELTFCQPTAHLPAIDNEGASLPIKLHSSFHVFLGKESK